MLWLPLLTAWAVATGSRRWCSCCGAPTPTASSRAPAPSGRGSRICARSAVHGTAARASCRRGPALWSRSCRAAPPPPPQLWEPQKLCDHAPGINEAAGIAGAVTVGAILRAALAGLLLGAKVCATLSRCCRRIRCNGVSNPLVGDIRLFAELSQYTGLPQRDHPRLLWRRAGAAGDAGAGRGAALGRVERAPAHGAGQRPVWSSGRALKEPPPKNAHSLCRSSARRAAAGRARRHPVSAARRQLHRAAGGPPLLRHRPQPARLGAGERWPPHRHRGRPPAAHRSVRSRGRLGSPAPAASSSRLQRRGRLRTGWIDLVYRIGTRRAPQAPAPQPSPDSVKPDGGRNAAALGSGKPPVVVAAATPRNIAAKMEWDLSGAGLAPAPA